ncbi:MAG: hypothetical protein DWQ05_11690 [Calditrichaeota bacterium]|nr:MAG: hypothetical protein DWQ05_11690 [Calditrichota bacterium]
MKIYIFAFILVLSAACSDRERSNPLDPQNPSSKGKPGPPVLYSTRDSVYISWSHLQFSDASSFNIYVREENESDFRLLEKVQPPLFFYWDTGCEYEKNRWYKISVSSAGFESVLSDEVQIRPGPTFLWATDRFRGQVTKYSHDGRYPVLNVRGFTEPFRIAMDTTENMFWVTDLWDGRLKQMSQRGIVANENISLLGMTDFAFDIGDDVVWATSYNFNAVARFNVAGLKELEISTFNSPWYVAVNTDSNKVFVLNDNSGEIVRMNYEGQIEARKTGFEGFWSMVYDQKRDRLWVGYLDFLIAVDDALGEMVTSQQISGFTRVAEIAIDFETGDIWCIDMVEGDGQSRVLKLSGDGDELLVLPGFSEPWALAVNHYNHHCFVAEGISGKIIELDAETGIRLTLNETGGSIANMVVQTLE